MDTKRVCLLVVGMHRSGTSAIAGTLALLGAQAPADPLKPTAHNIKGHFEPLNVLRVTKQLHEELGTCWYDFSPIDLSEAGPDFSEKFRLRLSEAIADSFGDASVLLLKDPRLSRFIPLTCSAIGDMGAAPYTIICTRNPLEVAGSLGTRNDMSAFHASNLWLRYMLDAEYGSRGLPRCFVAFSDFMADWRSTIGRIERQLGVSVTSGSVPASDVDEFLDGALYHEHSDIEGLRQRFGKTSWVYRCFETLDALAEDPNDEKSMRTFDDIRVAFGKASSSFSRPIADYFVELSQIKKAQKKTGKSRRELERELQESQQESRRLRNELAEVHSSSSWRLMSPLRRVAEFLKGFGSQGAK